MVTVLAFDRDGRFIGGGRRVRAFAGHELNGVIVRLAIVGWILNIHRLEFSATYTLIDLPSDTGDNK